MKTRTIHAATLARLRHVLTSAHVLVNSSLPVNPNAATVELSETVLMFLAEISKIYLEEVEKSSPKLLLTYADEFLRSYRNEHAASVIPWAENPFDEVMGRIRETNATVANQQNAIETYQHAERRYMVENENLRSMLQTAEDGFETSLKHCLELENENMKLRSQILRQTDVSGVTVPGSKFRAVRSNNT